ncbi:MAG TPA: glycosyltransferase, partial [Paracoccus sp. (in: a-proteobacteria)]|nr:glycosyltransferase [Paracoccus sp. (in: a-proteobacteria)]
AFTPLPTDTTPAAGYESVPARTTAKSDIFVLAIIGWDFRTQRPQHLAREMAASGHRVFYIEMERETGAGSAREVAPGVHVIRLPARGMRMLAPYTGVPSAAQARAWVDHFHALADAVGAGPVAHVVVEHPYWWHLARHLSPEYQITFDCMDDIGGFSNTEPHVLEAEMQMIAQADKMIVSSQYLHDKFGAMREVAMVRNGTDVSHFIREPEDEPAPEFLRGKLKPGAIRVGYVGAIAEWFDTDLLERVARDNPDFDIHLCGAVTAEAPLRLGKLPHVTLHGEIPYRDVPAFHKQMDVLIIPFQLLPIIKACDPVKFYEYSAVMRPTVSTALPELERAGDLVFTAGTAPDFAAAIRRAAPLAHDADFGRRLRQYALDNAWSFRAADMLAEMTREPKLSVVVLHYGEPDLTLAALHAMLGRGEVYPNLEVVLVDNGSGDAVLSVLRERAAADPRIVLVENGENLGFARGNNRGIEAATGEYVLLLNNDTFLAPGALLAMVRHLQRNPDIGIVGPMTNNIGNEARIEIAYAHMDQMIHAARDLATGHRGQWTPMAVCAYFCAMFRRADLDRLGRLPEIYGRGMFEDDDHCATFRAAGLQMALAEDAFCHHHLSATFDALPSGEKQALFERNKAVFEERWGPWVPHVYRNARPDPTLAEN